MNKETWKKIEKASGYEVSNKGRSWRHIKFEFTEKDKSI